MAEQTPRYQRVTVILNRSSESRRHLRVMERLAEAGVGNAIALRGVASISAGKVEVQHLAEMLVDQPVVILWVDVAEHVERVLPLLRSLVPPGIVLVEDVDAALIELEEVADLPKALTVGDVMTHDVVAVRPETPIREVVLDLVGRRFRAVPVVDEERHVVGIVSNGDLVRRGGLAVRVELLRSLERAQIQEYLAAMTVPDARAADVMSPDVVTVAAELDIREAATLMRARRLKRLPVVDAEERLIGIVSRVDLLRTVAQVARAPAEKGRRRPAEDGDVSFGSIMSTVVPAVDADAPVQEVLNAVVSTRLDRAIVVDEQRHVLGLVSDAELVDRLTPQSRPGALAALMRRLPFVHGSGDAQEALRQATGETARDLMRTDVTVAHEDDAVSDVIAEMLVGEEKLVAVTNSADELVGVVDRADLLRLIVDA